MSRSRPGGEQEMGQTTVQEVVERNRVTVPLRASLKRTKNGCFVYIEVDEQLEELFQTEETQQSNYWCNDGDCHEFYLRDYGVDLERYMGERYDSYGDTYVRRGKINAALLRTKGLSDGKVFHIDDHYSEETLVESLKQLKEIGRELYQQYVRPVRVTTRVTVQEM